MADKKADLAGPGISTYEEVAKILPSDYKPTLNRLDTQRGVFAIKRYIEDNLCKELNLNMVQVPLIVDRDSGVNDYLDRDGSRTPIDFPCGLGLDSSTARSARASAQTCGPCVRTISSTTTTAPMWINGTGSGRSTTKIGT